LTENLVVIVEGLGPEALALCGSCAGAAGLELYLVGRAYGNHPDIWEATHRNGGYSVSFPDGVQHVAAAGVFASDVPESREALTELASRQKYVLVCSATRYGQADVADFVRETVRRRRRRRTGGLLLLSPCENSVVPALAKLAVDLNGAGFVYLDTVPDRVARDVLVSVHGEVTVFADREYEWAASSNPAGPSGCARLAPVRPALEALQLRIHSDVTPVRERKTLLCNGVQTGVALLARNAGLETTNEYLRKRRHRLLFHSLSRELAVAWATLRPSLSGLEIERYRLWYADRVLMGDDVTRVLSRYSDAFLDELTIDFSRKLAYPLRLLRDVYGSEALKETVLAEICGSFVGEAPAWREPQQTSPRVRQPRLRSLRPPA
jgi:hypothetical protein